jgi:hypothetical protein
MDATIALLLSPRLPSMSASSLPNRPPAGINGALVAEPDTNNSQCTSAVYLNE